MCVPPSQRASLSLFLSLSLSNCTPLTCSFVSHSISLSLSLSQTHTHTHSLSLPLSPSLSLPPSLSGTKYGGLFLRTLLRSFLYLFLEQVHARCCRRIERTLIKLQQRINSTPFFREVDAHCCVRRLNRALPFLPGCKEPRDKPTKKRNNKA